MPLLGQAALAMWWEVPASARAEFEHWHSHEHLPERLGIPGFRRGTRWGDAEGGEGVFQMYELEAHAVLSSPAYLTRLNAPSPWSTRMMPFHLNMVRSQCHVLESVGAGVARHALTVRLSPTDGKGDALRASLRERFAAWATRPGLVGAHLLRHEAPAIALTTEQKIRGASDRYADWVLVIHGYDPAVLHAAAQAELSPEALAGLGAAQAAVQGPYTLTASVTPGDVA